MSLRLPSKMKNCLLKKKRKEKKRWAKGWSSPFKGQGMSCCTEVPPTALFRDRQTTIIQTIIKRKTNETLTEDWLFWSDYSLFSSMHIFFWHKLASKPLRMNKMLKVGRRGGVVIPGIHPWSTKRRIRGGFQEPWVPHRFPQKEYHASMNVYIHT